MKSKFVACVAATIVFVAPLASQTPVPLHFEDGLRRAIVAKNAPAERLSIADRMQRWRVPGLSVAIIEGCKVVDARGFGVTRTGGPSVQVDTLFQAASISKPVAAMAALKLVESGALDLDGDVKTRLKTWRLPDSPFVKEHPVTLRGILSHSAGLVPGGYGGYAPGEQIPTLVQTLQGIAPARPKPVQVEYAPGSQWVYAGGGYLVAQLLMIEAADRPFSALMNDVVLQPLGMTHSSFDLRPTGRSIAMAHNAKGETVEGGYHLYPEAAAAGLWTTASDLARFAIAAMKAERGEQGAILSKTMAKEMIEPEIGPRSLGFVVGGEGRARRFGHDGTNEGFNGMLIAYPETCQGAVLLGNSDNAKPLMSEVLRAIADAYRWPDAMLSAEQDGVAVTPDIIARFTGTYRVPSVPDALFDVLPDGKGGLMFDRRDGHTEPLLASSDGLYAPDSGVLITTRDPKASQAKTITYLRLGARGGLDAERVK